MIKKTSDYYSVKDTIVYNYGDYELTMILNKTCYRYSVTIINKKNDKSLFIPNQISCVYFAGVKNDIAIFDYGTSLIRIEYFYDLFQEKIIDTIYTAGLAYDKDTLHDNCYYSMIVPDKKISELKLPKCKNDSIEFSGYIEKVYFDFQQKKIISTGQIRCLR